MKSLYPKMYLRDIKNLPIKKLKQLNINTLFFDIDNTLAPHYEPEPNKDILDFLNNLKKSGFKIALLSNGKEKRVTLFNKSINVVAFHKAGKPMTKTLRIALEKLNSKPENTAIIGDQIFTDIWCGNSAKIYSILVKPLVTKDEWIVKLKRGIEKIVINQYLRTVKANDN